MASLSNRHRAKLNRKLSHHRRLTTGRLFHARIGRRRVTFRVWLCAIARKRFKILILHPHHYVTAMLLSVFLYATGYGESGAIIGAFCYAICENLATAADDV